MTPGIESFRGKSVIGLTGRRLQRIGQTLAVSALGVGCDDGSPAPPQSPPPPPALPVARLFTDVTSASGLAFTNGVNEVPTPAEVSIIAPSGVGTGDYDADGDIDLFIVRGDIGPNLLYRNDGNLTFSEVALEAGLANTKSATENYRHSGPMFADLDGDTDLDLFIGGLGGDPSKLFANNGDGTFTDVTAGSGIDAMTSAHTISAAFGDYDLDGYLDLFLAHWGTSHDFSAPGDTEHLWRNVSDAGQIRFQSVSEAAGISPSILTLPDVRATNDEEWDFTFSPAFVRINDDLYPDILSVADFNKSMVFINNRDGTFSNVTNTDVIKDDNGMGSAIGDFDNDGDLDWFISSIKCEPGSGNDCIQATHIGNRLYRNDNGVFVDVTSTTGVASGGWGWGACFVDFENDGDLDLYHTNGWPFTDDFNDFAFDKSRAFVSDGAGAFIDRAGELGLDDNEQGRGIVCADFDNDGDIDLLLLHRSRGTAATLWRNDSSTNNSLAIRLVGATPNTEAAGARLYVTVGGSTQMREVSIASNFVSQNPTAEIFGLDAAAQADEIRIEWPDGQTTILTNVAAGQRMVLEHPDN